MKTFHIAGMGSIVAVALLASGCATLNGPEAQANAAAQKQSCKVVLVDSAVDEIRLQARGGSADNTALEKTQAQLEVGRANLQDNRALATPGGRLDGVVSRAQRDC